MKALFNPNQLCALSRKSTRGMAWDVGSIKKGMQLRFACGAKGYEVILQQGYPLPSARTIQRRMKNIAFHSGVLDNIFSYMKIKVFQQLFNTTLFLATIVT